MYNNTLSCFLSVYGATCRRLAKLNKLRAAPTYATVDEPARNKLFFAAVHCLLVWKKACLYENKARLTTLLRSLTYSLSFSLIFAAALCCVPVTNSCSTTQSKQRRLRFNRRWRWHLALSLSQSRSLSVSHTLSLSFLFHSPCAVLYTYALLMCAWYYFVLN